MPVVLWPCSLGPGVRVRRGFERRLRDGEFMVSGVYEKCGLIPRWGPYNGVGTGNAERGRKHPFTLGERLLAL